MSDVKTLLKEARKFIDDKDFKAAQECCKEVLRKDKQNYLALVLLGKSLQDSDQAPLAYQKAIATKPSLPLAWQGLANFYERKNDDSSKAKLFPIYNEMLKLQMEDGKIIEILTKLGELGCSLKNSESVSSMINYINEHQEEKIKVDAEKQLVQLLKSDVPCKSEDIPMILSILNNLNNNNPSNSLMFLICKVILQKGDLISAVEEIIALDFFANNVEVKIWLCQRLCEIFIEHNSFNGLDVDKYIDIVSIDIENSKYVGLLKSMKCFHEGLYLEAYKQCVPLVDYQQADKVEAIFILKCTIMLKKWPVTQKLATNFLMKVKDGDLKLRLQKYLFLSYFEQQKWSDAINIAKEISTACLDTNELASLAKCYIETNESMEHVLNNLDEDNFTQIQGLALLKQGKYDEAITVLQKCKEDALNYFYIGKAYWNLKEYDNCLLNLLKSAKVNSDHAETFFFLGLYYDQHKKDLQKAKKCYEKAYSLCDYDSTYIKNLSEVYVKLGLNDSDYELLKKAKKVMQSKETWLNLRLGLHYLRKREWENAIINFRDVVKVTHNNLIALECLADAYYARGSYTSALKVYNKVISLNPNKIDSCHCLTNIGSIYALLTQYDEAILTFEKVLEIDPYFILALKGFAECSMKIARKKYEANLYGSARDNAQHAINNITKALVKSRKFMCLWNLLADALMFITRLPTKYCYVYIKQSFNDSNETVRKDKIDIYPHAIACFSYVAKHRQELTSYNLATAYFEYYSATKQIAHCHIAFNIMIACIKEAPSAWRNWNLLGKICVCLKRYDLAQHCFIKALTVTHKWSIAKIWCNLGTLYLQLNLFKLANHCYWRGQSTLPSYPQSWIGQALIAEVIRKEEAMDLFRHASRLGYHPISALGYADWICRTFKNLSWKSDPECKYAIEGLHAITYGTDLMEWYLTFEPNDPCACNILGNLQERNGLLCSALKSYQKAHLYAENDKKNMILLNVARIFLRLKKYDEAIKTYKGIDEASLDSSCGLALALYKTGQYEDSYSVYDMALQWLCNDDSDKADILVAMAGIVNMFKGKDDAKTLLFHSIQASQKKPTPYSLFSLCSLGIINSDQSLTKSALNELRKYEKEFNFAFDIGFLKSYVVSKDDIELAIQIICDALHNHPSNGPLWFCMSEYCLRSQATASVASGCAQRSIKLSTYNEHKSRHIGKMFALASVAEYIAGDKRKSLKFGKEGLHINPCQSEIWAAVIFALTSNQQWSNNKDWLLATLGYMRKQLEMARPLSRWINLIEKKLTR